MKEVTCPSCSGVVEVGDDEILVNCPFCRNQFSVIRESLDFTIDKGVLIKYNGEDSEVEVPSGVTSIGVTAFLDKNTLSKIVLPEGVTELQSGFMRCSNLETIILPNSLEIIPQMAFQGCISLKSLVLPKNLKSLGEMAFYDCKKLSSIEIPPMVETVDCAAFFGCESLETISYYKTTKFTGEHFQGCGSLSLVNVLDSKTGKIVSQKRIEEDEYGLRRF
ncbi:MAG: leucine-rich repeat domain-containing protein [Methanobrevibacter sp.]|nr:leucine-rich repeat domain-containing protein [Methanobrevibacter sp.]